MLNSWISELSAPSNTLATHPLPAAQPVIGNGREVPAPAAAKPDTSKNATTVPLRVVASAAPASQPQKKHLQEDRPPQTKVPAAPKDLNKAPATAHAKSDIKQAKDTNADLSELRDGNSLS
ncbi:hypothetical protein EDB19DRAFT_1920344 [Suillus lakei]|nr:hypothetical protein EDB19DRAFT_1920344 [Suillus lakei]